MLMREHSMLQKSGMRKQNSSYIKLHDILVTDEQLGLRFYRLFSMLQHFFKLCKSLLEHSVFWLSKCINGTKHSRQMYFITVLTSSIVIAISKVRSEIFEILNKMLMQPF